ncbi:hypothetical protein E2562_031604 [Oryza meyeriana var. granulata]|uniref:DUF4220 domain-containing protein n=1 Tax=Oryza meyeriana var. granulata TaxID=110450 RepID=A0A6G1CIW7_9ORYZ|nr:hypothetical protein E2562_031604 [Oryza meyeriana var. granulata]
MAVQGTTAYRSAFKEKIEDDEKLLPYKRKLSMPTKLFVDFACPYSDRLADLEFFYALDWDKAYKRINVGISNIFNLLYTRDINTELNDIVVCCCACTWMLTVVLAIVAIVLLHISHKQAYSHYDVIVTFMLVYGTLLLDILSVFILALFTGWLADDVAQQSLIGFFTRNKRHTWLISVAECLQCKGLLDEYWCMTPCAMSKSITYLAFEYVRDGWTKYIHDAESYRRFNDNLGQWALERAECGELLGWSLEKPFDEIVLIWHVATDFCYHMSSIHNPSGRAISNYMMHLLFANPEMLMPGSRRNLFTTAYSELEEILQSEENLPLDDEKKLTITIIDKVKSKEDCFIHDAWRLAKGLMGLDDKDKMWYLIRDVWVEMLCFSAGRCRGYLHAKSLGSGVEHLSYVWLLLAHSGMETFSERLQRRRQLCLPMKEPQNIEDGDAGPSDSRELKPSNLKEEDIHAPPSISQGAESRGEKQNHAAPSAPQGEGSTVAELNEIKVVPQ